MEDQIPPQFRGNPRLLNSLWRLLMDEIGGPHMIEVLFRHHVEGYSLRKLAELENIPVGTLRGRMEKAKRILDRVDLWPAQWVQRDQPSTSERQNVDARAGGDPEQWRFKVVRLRPESPFEKWVRALSLAR